MSEIINWIVDTVSSLGYFGIFILMFVESSFIPFPSEVIMIPAGYLAFKGKMDLSAVILCGILGSLLGALLNYYLAAKLGRPLLLRYGKYIFFHEEHLKKMETFFVRHGHISTFTGRLLPMVRQYISIPAGLARMKLSVFSLYTGLGAGIWVMILTLLGYFIGENEMLIKEYLRDIILGLFIFCLVCLAFYWYRQQRRGH
ncbi:membrane protein DedA, SNARE-associated domain [Nitrosomonas cryotolerans]|uniref:Membrane protein DedA, SNARE-associated domain n=2 Tax=Nitrosomonas cryotolerans TaxID=44575 RepID=A0A1N6I4P4_9PROT|nr:DedA family protein [Nitrosomonas cryotolerans]SFQ12994.1 membrane protein DedA, SNARE-associated domain [Nitrosomonas cryotolerans]SIO26929.1 membrane protein DedA, SNARE-associated domain [Nitrosomonas cryotolerans ATCC 49181]